MPGARVLVIANIEWSFVWQRHQTIAAQFARDYEVIFCEIPGLRRITWRDARRIWARLGRLIRRTPAESHPVPEHLRIVRPFVLPATNAVFCGINRWLISRFARRLPIPPAGVELVINYSPTDTAGELVRKIKYRRLVYDCTDDWLAVRGIPARLARDERWLLQTADLTVVPSRRLEELKRPDARRIKRLPHGALIDRFIVPERVPPSGDRMTVLYYGHLYAQHLDFDAIDRLAATRPNWRIMLVGPVKTPHRFPPNVETPGQQPHERLRDWIAQCDVLILPYTVNDYTRSVMPAKTYECLATGRPVVATPLPELVGDFGEVMSFAAASTWETVIEQAIRDDSRAARERRIALARANSWSDRYGQLRKWLRELDETVPTPRP